MDDIVKLIGKNEIKLERCDINMESIQILNQYQKKSESPSEILFADLVKTSIKPYEDPVKFPVALKVFVDLEKVDKNTLTKKELDIYNDNIYDIIGIKYEAKMYKKIYKLIIDGICPNFIPYVGFAECTKDEILKSIPDKDKQEFGNNLIFGNKDIDLSVNILITARPENNITLQKFLINDNISNYDKKCVILQCLYTLYVLRTEKIRHNDLHFSNILISIHEKPVKYLFIMSKDKREWFYVKTRYVPLFFDWDMSYNKKLGKNEKIDNYLCAAYNICSTEDKYFDTYTFLCHIKEFYCENIENNLCSFLSSSYKPVHEEHNCRPYATLTSTKIKSIENILDNEIFDEFRYNKKYDRPKNVFGYPENVLEYVNQ